MSKNISAFPPIGQGNSIEVTRVYPVTRSDLKTVAFVDIRDGPYRIKGLSVVCAGNGPFVSLPKRKTGNQWLEIVEIDEPTRRQIADTILADERVRELIGKRR